MITCLHCHQPFEHYPEENAFLAKIAPVIQNKTIAIPSPLLCPDCRMQRRLSFRNQTTLYKRKCDHTKQDIISIYSPESDMTVYSPDAWWSDAWDALSYGKPFDFSRSFFDQFHKLMRAVPHISVLKVNSENSDFTNQTYNCRNCYLCSAIKDCEDCHYCHNGNDLRDCMDCSFCFKSELLYQCHDIFDSYNCTYAANSIQCTDSFFLYDCVGCSNCFGCAGLRNKQYHYFNERCTREEYQQKIAQHNLRTTSGLLSIQKKYRKFLTTKPRVFAWLRNCEFASGDNLKNAKNAAHCFDCNDIEDCRHCTWVFASRDCQDCYGMGGSEVVYDCVGVEEVQRVAFSFGTSNSIDCYYTDLCMHCDHCFGCVGLRKKHFCILNKQYTKEEYEELLPRIIEQMHQTDAFGVFFPSSVSAFAYNESKASEHYPLTKEKTMAQGLRWKDDMDQIPHVEKTIPASRLPDDQKDIPDDVLNWAIISERSTRPYILTKQELVRYRRQQLAIPLLHPDERQKERMHARNPQRLWRRECGKCGKEMETSYSPEKSEIVVCEECYLKEVY